MAKTKDLFCNVCGKKLRIENGILKEDVLAVEKEWGYFSSRDLEVHKFLMCEECYDEFIEKFAMPIRKAKKKIVL